MTGLLRGEGCNVSSQSESGFLLSGFRKNQYDTVIFFSFVVIVAVTRPLKSGVQDRFVQV